MCDCVQSSTGCTFPFSVYVGPNASLAALITSYNLDSSGNSEVGTGCKIRIFFLIAYNRLNIRLYIS
jgi:hypothetical protein